MDTPTVAAIHGYCVGGGLELALACDIRIASENAVFFTPELRWGLLHAYGARRLAAVVGLGRATHMLLTGQRIGSDQALTAGLVTEVVPAEQVLDEAVAVASHIAALPPVAVRITRELLRAAAGGLEALAASRLAIAAAAAAGENVALVPEFRGAGSA
jgi:enoyl-CoA hydratase/carnithine racemase